MAKKDAVTVKTKDSSAKGKNAEQQQNFLAATKEELSKVVWPSRQQLISESVAVILMVILVATVIYFVDQFFGWLASQPFLFG